MTGMKRSAPCTFRRVARRRRSKSFERGLALLHHMTYPQAREAFERAAALDPHCAMAQWGIAMTLFQPLWPTRPDADDAPARLERARRRRRRSRRRPSASDSYVATARGVLSSTRRRPTTGCASAAGSEAIGGAPRGASGRRRGDGLLRARTAGHRAGERRLARERDRAAAILLGVYERNPDHPGAMHYLVHANDVPGRERESLDITRKYEAAAPRNPHALHMPTHIYTRLGDWDGVIRGNLLAADAALQVPGRRPRRVRVGRVPARDRIPRVRVPPEGRGRQGRARSSSDCARRNGWSRVQDRVSPRVHAGAVCARAPATGSCGRDRCRARARQPRLGPFPVARSDRPVRARPRRGAPGPARRCARRGQRLAAAGGECRTAGEELFARNIRVLRLELEAWIAQLEGKPDAAIERMQEAASSKPRPRSTP